MAEWTKEELTKAYESLAKRARTDKDFRAFCLSEPNKAIEDVAGRPLPANFNVRLKENEGASMTFVLPDYAKSEN